MKALLTIESIRLKRSLGSFLLAIGIPLFFFTLFSSTVQMEQPEAQESFLISYMLTMTSFSMSSFALFSFPMMLVEDQKNHWLSFLRHSPLPLWKYHLSKILRVGLCFLASILIVFLNGAFLRNIQLTLATWLLSVLLLLLTATVYLALGLCLQHIQSEQTLSLVANVLFLLLAILGGSWMPISLFPDWLQGISKLTPSYHVNQLVVQYALKGEFLWKSLLVVLGYAIIFYSISSILSKQKKVRLL
ncbi:ABC transporter permease [Streptococcus danieliae]|uniref:ABC transporter permease n=1 Tax=Streptococcus danieliae TaxID=747656 RepID=A0A7X3KDD9_9STRE|nr:ABC transporter permease [Streptococcus danieliae]MVX59573.1 ABC transporter permease [Streptococcus danieliae]